jgi:hypothetical protein|tara:strand:- start:5415 stop:5972 length:558 start_codon:yes stop_codon:yes gene_type:complete
MIMENQLNIEQFSNIELDNNTVSSITEKCNELKTLQDSIEEKEEEISKLKQKAKSYEERIIPDMMQEAGVQKLELSDGTKVEVKPFYAAKIPESRNDEAFDWLRNNGHGDMIKNVLTANIDKGQDNQVSVLIDLCEKLDFSYTQKQKVEPMTLKAFVKEQVEKGKEVPFDMFGVYIANKTKLTKK